MLRLAERVRGLGGAARCNTFASLSLAISSQYGRDGVPTVYRETEVSEVEDLCRLAVQLRADATPLSPGCEYRKSRRTATSRGS